MEGKHYSIRIFFIFLTILAVFQSIRLIPDSVISLLTLVSYAWGLIIIILILIKCKPFLPKQRLFGLFCILAAFFVGYGITIILNRNMNLLNNMKGFVSTGIQLFLLFFYLAYADTNDVNKIIREIMKTLIVITLMVAVANIYIYTARIFDKSPTGRVQGVFSNPNNVSVCVLALACSLWFLRFEKGHRVFHIINIILQLIATILSNSRASILFLASVFVTFVFLYSFEKKKLKKWVSLLMALGMIIVGIASYKTIQVATTYFPVIGDAVKQIVIPKKQVQNQQKPIVVKPANITRSTQGEGISSSIRLNLIMSGWTTFKKYPFFGVSPRNIASVVVTLNPTKDLQGIEVGGLHNAYLQLLVANGIIGVLSILFLVIYCIKVILSARQAEAVYASAILASLLIYGLFEYSLIFANTATCLMFWGFLGYAVNVSLKVKNTNKSLQ